MKPLLAIKQLNYEALKNKNSRFALKEISLEIFPGETLGLVGESGSGKTTLAKCILQLLKLKSGEILYKGKPYSSFDKTDLKNFREEVQLVFQDPYSSLNPRMTLEEIIEEPLFIANSPKKKKAKEKVLELLKLVGLDEHYSYRYPHELSGGQRQRVAIARALILEPKLLILDEPIAALDVSIQAQILNLLKDLSRKLELTYLFISHDLPIVKYISDRVAVMYLGEIVEVASSNDLYENPSHPYTKSLLHAIPKL